jgi:hypothetical protein
MNREGALSSTRRSRCAAFTRELAGALLSLALATSMPGSALAAGASVSLGRIAGRIAILNQASPSLLAREEAIRALIATEWVFLTNPTDMSVTCDPGQCGTVVNLHTPAPPANSGITSITDDPPSGSYLPLGTYTVKRTTRFSDGTIRVATFTLNVAGIGPPEITCPPSVVVLADPGQCGAHVGGSAAGCGPTFPVTGMRSDGQPLSALYPVGTTMVTWTVTSPIGVSSCQQMVTVKGIDSPQIACPADLSVDSGGEDAASVNPTASVSGQCGLAASVSGSRSDGLGLTDLYPLGTTTITWTATDADGNQSQCTQKVTVRRGLVPPRLADPHLDAIVLDHGPVGQQAILHGHGFADLQGSSYVTLGGHQIPVLAWSASAITVLINPLAYGQSALPLDASYPIQVVARDADKKSNIVNFLLTSASAPA